MVATCSESLPKGPAAAVDGPSRQHRLSVFSFAFGALTTCILLFILRTNQLYMVETPRVFITTSSVHSTYVVQSSRTCNRMKVPPQYINETQGPYNPAAVRDPSTGKWHAIMTLDEVRTRPCSASILLQPILSWTAVSRLSVHGLQIWFGISNYTRFGTYLERRMRSHPLVLDMGNGTLPSTEASPAVRMLDLDASYQQLANAEGAQVYKAADWRYVPLLYHHHKSVPFEGPLPSNRLSCRP